MSGEHTHPGDGTVPGLHGEPIPTPVLGCPACVTVHSIGGEFGATFTSPAPSLADFLLARIAEDAGAARRVPPFSHRDVVTTLPFGPTRVHVAAWDPSRVLAECEAKRRIVALHQAWPVLVETPPELSPAAGVNDMTFRMTQQIAWLTQEEYRKRFGEEPPTTPMLRALALPYADHPDYRTEWRP